MSNLPTTLLHLDLATQIFFLAPLVAIALDVITGILNALKSKNFSVAWLGNFAQQNILPYAGLLLTLLIVPLASGIPYQVAANAADAAFGLYCISQLQSVDRNIAQLLGKPALSTMLDNAINGGMAKLFLFVPSTPVPADVSAVPTATPSVTSTNEPSAGA